MENDPLSDLIRRHASRHRADERLRADIRARIALEAAATAQEAPLAAAATPAVAPAVAAEQAAALAGTAPAVTPAAVAGRQPAAIAVRGVRPGKLWTFGLGGALAGFAAGVLITLTVSPQLGGGAAPALPALTAELVGSHVRSLAEGPLIQVASTDRHTVKPWFQGKIDYAPPVFNLAEQGYPLVGGRVDRVHGQATAVLVFEHHRHMLDLFVWPSDRVEPETRVQQRGFNLVHWSDGAMQYWAVSDMDVAEIGHFGTAWRNQP